MTTQSAPTVGSARPSKGITATWNYTFWGVIVFELLIVLLWWQGIDPARASEVPVLVAVAGLVWVASTIPVLFAYRRRLETEPASHWLRITVPLVVAAGFGGAAFASTGLWALLLLPLAQTLVLLSWPPGVRLRLVLALTLVLTALVIIDSGLTVGTNDLLGDVPELRFLAFYSILLPALTVMSLWWWDVFEAIDRARISEAKLAATQERLRVATDVHDLQGHHLQVIALQLELAERLMPTDPDAAMEQLRASRASVDEARQGTRDLATKFRAVPLRDEVANAADLLRAAGTRVSVSVDASTDGAPASVIAPIIRETTTNIIRHGGGNRASFSLTREGSAWRYEVSNDIAPDTVVSTDSSGLEGMRRRAVAAGGTLDIHTDGDEFTVRMLVPAEREAAQ